MPALLAKKIALVLLYSGYVTFYNPEGRTLSCLAQMGEPEAAWKWDGKREGVAHRWLPCGSTVYVRVAGKTVKTKVLDRGPYTAIDASGAWHVASPPYLRKWWRAHLADQGVDPTDDEISKLSRQLPPGWRWRSIVDILYSLKPKLGTKGGRQPGQLMISPGLWAEVKDIRPENDEVVLPGQDPPKSP